MQSYVIRLLLGKLFLHRSETLTPMLAFDIGFQQLWVERLPVKEAVVFHSDNALLHAHRSGLVQASFDLELAPGRGSPVPNSALR